ncbi:hypothetical protein Zmor_008119 [Zophobas morio]|uniref:Uncharacterized protein n=1 Tax=Zophobas morio TaxID=2755281 RepID=A0AA38IYW6_9CUCU|nr:hypothetical protein Zmor_008119 [Zophobas morio]
MAPTLYMLPASPAVRSVQITAKAIGLQMEEKLVDLSKGEHLKPEYLKLNPQHTVPTLVDDDGLTIWDSHAINAYLVSKYAKNDSLYPKDLAKRAIIDQRLHFDSGVAFPAGARITAAILRAGKKSIDDSDKESVNAVYAFLETFLEKKSWMAGESVTIADYNLYATVTTLNVLVPLDGQKYQKLASWLKKVDGLSEAEANKKGIAGYEAMIKSLLA